MSNTVLLSRNRWTKLGVYIKSQIIKPFDNKSISIVGGSYCTFMNSICIFLIEMQMFNFSKHHTIYV